MKSVCLPLPSSTFACLLTRHYRIPTEQNIACMRGLMLAFVCVRFDMLTGSKVNQARRRGDQVNMDGDCLELRRARALLEALDGYEQPQTQSTTHSQTDSPDESDTFHHSWQDARRLTLQETDDWLTSDDEQEETGNNKRNSSRRRSRKDSSHRKQTAEHKLTEEHHQGQPPSSFWAPTTDSHHTMSEKRSASKSRDTKPPRARNTSIAYDMDEGEPLSDNPVINNWARSTAGVFGPVPDAKLAALTLSLVHPAIRAGRPPSPILISSSKRQRHVRASRKSLARRRGPG